MQLDYSREYLVWDNVEPVSYQSTRKTGSAIDVISIAQRIELTAREKQASGGVYVGAELNWLVPAALLAPGFVPKPGDVVSDRDSNDYTVLDHAGQLRDQNGYQVWRLHTLSLAIAYDLRDVIDIERAEITYDAAGAQVKKWPADGAGTRLYPNLSARVQELSGEMVQERGIQGFKGNYTIWTAKQIPSVTFEDRVKWVKNGVTYYLNILGTHTPDRIDELPALDAVLAP